MQQLFKAGRWALAGAGMAALLGCADGSGPTSLEGLVITDPSFDFSTTETVRLDLVAGAEPRAIEARDAEGRRLMDGAFKEGVSIDLKVPVGRAEVIKLRIGSGDDAVERELVVDASRRAVSEL